ncbi:hypothetical protein CAEBREN_24919 [Caenorhabditis brenneri]|uniref:Uncharacterized protein n=1 Tax=Caenorhabditis brenneri TaxID=135651 RepID=G0MY37_CAEBE|nr:hypothetical protein CAEBREN_24919 [Caenorhabditis brenneri]
MYLDENPKIKWCPRLTEDYVLEEMGDDLHKEDMEINQKLTLFRDLKIIMLSDIEQFLEDKHGVLNEHMDSHEMDSTWVSITREESMKTSHSPLNPPATSSSSGVPPTNSLTTVPMGVTTEGKHFDVDEDRKIWMHIYNALIQAEQDDEVVRLQNIVYWEGVMENKTATQIVNSDHLCANSIHYTQFILPETSTIQDYPLFVFTRL